MKRTLVEMYSAMTTILDTNLDFYEDFELINDANETLSEIGNDDVETVEYLAYAFLDAMENDEITKAEKIAQSVFWLLFDEGEG